MEYQTLALHNKHGHGRCYFYVRIQYKIFSYCSYRLLCQILFRKLIWRSVENIQIWFKMDKNIEQFARDLITLILMTDTCSLKTQGDHIFCPPTSTMVTRICHNVTLHTLKVRSSLVLCPFQKRKLDTFNKQLSVFDRVWVHVCKYSICCYSQTAKPAS
jgi:hypothetical protein